MILSAPCTLMQETNETTPKAEEYGRYVLSNPSAVKKLILTTICEVGLLITLAWIVTTTMLGEITSMEVVRSLSHIQPVTTGWVLWGVLALLLVAVEVSDITLFRGFMRDRNAHRNAGMRQNVAVACDAMKVV